MIIFLKEKKAYICMPLCVHICVNSRRKKYGHIHIRLWATETLEGEYSKEEILLCTPLQYFLIVRNV